MAISVGQIVIIILIVIGALIAAIGCGYFCESGIGKGLGIGVPIVVAASVIGLIFWYNTTASGQRYLKDCESDYGNGLNREITITAEDGRRIFHYEGKVDIETKHEGNANYILFDDEQGKRYIIYYGVQDTVLIIEK